MIGRDGLFRKMIDRPVALIGLIILMLILLAALLASVLYPDGALEMVAMPFLTPGADWTYPLGTDQLGRDVAAQLLYGARVSLMVGFSAALVATTFGVLIGAFSGYLGGLVDSAALLLTELFQTIPSFILAIVFIVIMGASTGTIILALGIVSWPPIARIVRAECLSLRSRDFIQSCVVLGMGDFRIVMTQVLPNCIAPIVVAVSITIATAILTEASLSFLGLSDPNIVSWGSMIGAGRTSLRGAAYLTFIPGIAILITVLAISWIGDGLNDALNPRLRAR